MTTAISRSALNDLYGVTSVLDAYLWKCAIADIDPPEHFKPAEYTWWFNYKTRNAFYTNSIDVSSRLSWCKFPYTDELTHSKHIQQMLVIYDLLLDGEQ